MRSLIQSDLFRNFMGGFVMGVVALVALTPAEGSTALKTKIEAIYKA